MAGFIGKSVSAARPLGLHAALASTAQPSHETKRGDGIKQRNSATLRFFTGQGKPRRVVPY
jgi:hypothetical protein